MVYWSTLPTSAPARLRERSPEYGGERADPADHDLDAANPARPVPTLDAANPTDSAPPSDSQNTPDSGPARDPETPGASPPTPDPWTDVDALEELADRIATLEAHITVARYELLAMVAEFDRRRGWELGGHRDCAAWLAYRLDMHRRTALEKVRVARAIEELPLIGDAMKGGELSYSKVRALTRVAEPESEEELLELGRCLPVGQLEKTLRGWRSGSRETEERRAKELHRLRRLAVYADDEGSYGVRGRLTPEEGLRVQRALDWAMDMLFREKEAREGTTHKQRVADALVFLIDRAVEAGMVPDRQEAEPGEASAEEGPNGPPRSGERGRGDREEAGKPRSGERERGDPEEGAERRSGERERGDPEEGAERRSGEREREPNAIPVTAENGTAATTENDTRPATGKDPRPTTGNGAEPVDQNGSRPADDDSSPPHTSTCCQPPTRSGRRAISSTMAERYLVFLHLDLDTLDPDSGPGRAELDDGHRISPEAARRLTCDASVVNAIRGEHGEVLDVGRRYRTAHPALRRALEIRDRGCRFPGCDLRWTTPHHVEHWAVGGETSTKNCVLLCGHHHWLVHEGGWKVHLNNRDATALFVDLEGRFHMSRRPGPAIGDEVDVDEEDEGWPEEVRRWLAARGKVKTVNGRAVLPRRTGAKARSFADDGRAGGAGEAPGEVNGRTNASGREPAGSGEALVRKNEDSGVDLDGWSLAPRHRRQQDIPLDVYTRALDAFNDVHLR